MSNYWNNQVMLPAEELIETMDGTNVLVGTFLKTPVKIVFDCQSTVSIVLYASIDGGASLIQWKTFTAGEVMVLDDDLYTFPKGMSFYANGASGDFSIAYTYLKE